MYNSNNITVMSTT